MKKAEKAKVDSMLTEAVSAASEEIVSQYTNPQIICSHEVRRATLDEIHQVLTDQLLRIVQDAENLSPQMIAAVSKFLADNGARLGVVTAESPMGNILKNLPFQVSE